MNFSRQALLGIGMIMGGSVMLFAMVQQIGANNKSADKSVMIQKADTQQATPAPLTTDIDTEKRILAQKQKERTARVAEQEKRAQQFSIEQETAESQALAKSRTENQRYIENTTPDADDSTSLQSTQTKVVAPKVQPRVSTATNTVPTATVKAASSANKEAQQAEAKKKLAAEKQVEDKKQAEAEKKILDKKQAKAEDSAKKKADAKREAEAKLAAEKKAAKQQARAEEKAAVAAKAAKTEAPTSTLDYKVKPGDGLIKLARQYNVPVAALAQANSTSASATLQLGQTIVIPSRKQVQRLEREAAAAEKARAKEQAQAKRSAETKRQAQQKLVEARKEVKETDAKGSFGVQVALAGNQASADEVAKKFKDAGYKVKTSNTSRGVRVIVGPERGKIAALALKDKVDSDPKVNSNGAWVLYWR